MATKRSSSPRSRGAASRRSTSSSSSSGRSPGRSHGRSAHRKQAGSGDYTHVTTDHDRIRRWAEARGATPACVRGTGSSDDPGLIRLDFPDYSGADSLQPVDWDEWFEKFDERNLALVYREKTAKGDKSNFNKLVSRDDVRPQYGRGGGSSTAGSAKSKSRSGSKASDSSRSRHGRS